MEVSSHYILDRWRKGIKRKHNSIKNCYVDEMSNEYMCMYHDLYSKFVNVAEAVVVSHEKLEYYKKYLDFLYVSLINMNSENISSGIIGEEPLPDLNVHSPIKVRSKGCPSSKRKAPKVYKPSRKQVKISEICNKQNAGEDVGFEAS
ncbi:hypothetical protein QJS10_CPA09g00801 [Acorus calamus]|uniref:Protein FAR1-RELATED SEQUENCE n=1 Tax=Acorus calamus TaxID=4465 RepID=A0AAV9E1Z4_ACOCL|nr:hypothetical protein QJS10_CPA09g00801 [Acorus calamus]